ncbi:MAG: alpha/beta fold hydrolase [Gammaproteobacteria bacterium]|nr:alpha/beta fold hydrolase [Gammaproteobacteria bacterium]
MSEPDPAGAASPGPPADDFNPPAWLRSRHLQSMLASTAARRGPIARRAAPLIAAQREMLLDCGAGVRLQCFRSTAPQGRGVPVVLLHGWEGSAESLYVLSLGQQLFERGFDVLRLNLRDHGDTHHLNRGLFHSCLLPEVVGATSALQAALGGQPLRLVGFSLGGNFVLRVGAQARAAGLRIAQIFAVSPVLDPSDTLRALESGFAGYPLYFVRKWWRSLLKKQAAWPAHYDFTELRGVRDLRRLTAELIRRFTGFGSLEEYLDGYSITGGALLGLEAPTTIITSLDDPIIPAGGLERLAHPSSLRIVVTRFGGHCGFLDRLTGPTWVERRILAELDVADQPAALDPVLDGA